MTVEGAKRFVTVEVATEQCAYRFQERLDSPLKEGEWIRFEGKARVQVVSEKNEPEELERIMYYHQPYDGSDVRDWIYFDLRDVECGRIGPLDVISSLQSAMQRSKVHVDDWFSNCSVQELLNTYGALVEAHEAIKRELEKQSLSEADDVPVVAPDIDI
ncbi:hypothetical protein LCGC14_1436140 [marine sediment metagenome]|uniref:Uncharacterized protein n=1 Tax=marine sediment metagenome TaxID=412755 RepID=A0A0F9MP04_9ZZZZ